ncbi:MAG: alpha/beta fold hydrolase [Candidatus Eremiobacteraeota bacterium]|nr:alpha/beta fold hydrolase [Candidatus Eremiobacteraeota bacterium]
MIERTLDIGRLVLENGESLEAVKQHATIYGDQVTADKIVLVTHALSGNSRAADWWAPLIGPGRLFDPQHDCVICINTLGSCYGSSGPDDVRPFPTITVGDMVNAQARALHRLGINYIDIVIGGSLGGMQALQWALAYPRRVGTAIVIGAYDHFSAQGIALNALGREAIRNDPRDGLSLARKIAMLSYKSDELLEERHSNRIDRNGGSKYDVEGYLDYQGAQFASRMSAQSYVCLTKAMDAFDVRGYPIERTDPRLIFVGISSDWLFRPERVYEASLRMQARGFDARYVELTSRDGHDAFLSNGALIAGELLAI